MQILYPDADDLMLTAVDKCQHQISGSKVDQRRHTDTECR